MQSLISALRNFVGVETCPVNEQLIHGFVAGAQDGWGRARNRVAAILKANASGVPDSAACFFKDGDKWCAVFADFKSLQESPAGFGDTFDQAFEALAAEHAAVRPL